jgi:hypothetical protein
MLVLVATAGWGEVADDVYGVTRVTNEIQVDVSAPPPTPRPAPEGDAPARNNPPEEAPAGAPENSR